MTERQQDAVHRILREVGRLAAEYSKLTSRPLGVTGEVAEHAAAERLELKLAGPREEGFDGTRQTADGREERIQIKKGASARKAKSRRDGLA